MITLSALGALTPSTLSLTIQQRRTRTMKKSRQPVRTSTYRDLIYEKTRLMSLSTTSKDLVNEDLGLHSSSTMLWDKKKRKKLRKQFSARLMSTWSLSDFIIFKVCLLKHLILSFGELSSFSINKID